MPDIVPTGKNVAIQTRRPQRDQLERVNKVANVTNFAQRKVLPPPFETEARKRGTSEDCTSGNEVANQRRRQQRDQPERVTEAIEVTR